MPYDINTSLENIEKSLKDIQSAREQVEQTVSTSKNLQSVVSGYATSVESLLANVKDWMNKISIFQKSNIDGAEDSINKICASCNTVIKTFSSSTKDLTSNLKEKVEEELGKFEDANSKLISQVDKLVGLDEHLETIITAVNVVKEKLNEMHKELKDSQKAQDKSLDALKKGQDGVSEKADNIISSCNKISSKLGDVAEGIKGVTDLVHELKNEIGMVKSYCENYTKQFQLEIGKLDGKMDFLQKQMESTAQAEKKEISINRWIIVVGVVALGVLLFFYK